MEGTPGFMRGYTTGFPQTPQLLDQHFLTIKAMDKPELEVFLQQVKMARNWYDVLQYLNHQQQLKA